MQPRGAEQRDIPETGVMLEHVVVAEVVEGKGCRVGLGVGAQREVEEEPAEGFVDVEGVKQGVFGVFFGDVLACVGEEAVVCEGVEHRTGGSHYRELVMVRGRGAMGGSYRHRVLRDATP